MFQVTGRCNELLIFPVIIIERAWTRKPFHGALWLAQGGAQAPLWVSSQWLSSVNSLSCLSMTKSHTRRNLFICQQRGPILSAGPPPHMVGVCAVDLDNDGLMPSFSLLFCSSPSLPVVFQQIALLDLHMVAGPGVSLPSQLRVFVLLSFWDYPCCALWCLFM